MDKYTWVDVGSSYLSSDMLAAFLYAQLEAREQDPGRTRSRIWEYYNANLEGLGDASMASGCRSCRRTASSHITCSISSCPRWRSGGADRASESGAASYSVFHYLPLHDSEMGRRLDGKRGDCPVTEEVSDQLLRLPFYNDLAEHEQARIVAAILEFEGV